ncbi:DUF1493 family protein [Erwinia billingiae]|uniref:DUF1493 family protein n=1 Tax=Erwinia billingiae TaxID=182337 RepID=UPI003207A862
MMDNADGVRKLAEKHFWKMPDDASLNTGKESVLPVDVMSFLEEYAEVMQVDMTDFHFNHYYPNASIRFLPNAILPKYLRTERHSPQPLTVNLLIAAAGSGRWPKQ